ncbi:MAG: hypothetical protein HOP04_00230 [Methylophilaceae bacterium]|nr:hypothetical protein [Methylophilaceae bacterium]
MEGTRMIRGMRIRLMPLMVILMALSIAGLLWCANALYQAHVYHQHLAHKSMQTSQSADALFANATLLAKKSDEQKALALYARVAANGDLAQRKAAHYNSANLYLSQATDLLEKDGYVAWDKAAPLLALAKESYREALRLDPAWVEAKYNYELALRLSPSIESKKDLSADDEEQKTEESPSGWPSIPGFPRGMP